MTPYTVVECLQRSPEWYAARSGRLTGSNAAKAIAFLKKGGEMETRRKLRLRLVAERLTGLAEDEDTFITKELTRGIELEPKAAAAYEANKTDPGLLRWSGFLAHNELQAGCSLDGHVSDDGGERIVGIVEIKCPKTTTHLDYLLAGVVPDDYFPQAMHNLWISGAEWLDFVSFDDRLPAALQLFSVRVRREQLDIDTYAKQAVQLLEEVDRDVELILSGGRAPFGALLEQAAAV